MSFSVESFLRKPYATTSVRIDMGQVDPNIKTKLKKALTQGYIDVRKGDSALLYGMLCHHYKLPMINVPCRGYRNKDLIVDWRSLDALTRTDLQSRIMTLADDLFEAEMIAKKLTERTMEYQSRSDQYKPKAADENWRETEYGAPGRHIGKSYAQWDFKVTHPKWAEVLAPLVQGEILAPRYAQARAAVDTGVLILTENK